jgi:hypothetical protein
MLARARSEFESAASVTVEVESTSAGDSAPPFDHWTETVTASGKTTHPRFTGSTGPDPIACSSLATCAHHYLEVKGLPLNVGRVVGVGNRPAFRIYAKSSDDRLLGFPGWSAIIDAKAYVPFMVVDGEACSHCYYLTYHFRVASRR